jgi:hypothetical protein
MNILHNPQFNIDKVTAHYTKKDGVPVHYVCTSDLDESDRPFDIYYRKTPHPIHNNYYFGLYYSHDIDRMMICNADSIEKYQFGMISETDTDEWVYSQSHHDSVEIDSGFIGGGRRYIRRGGDLNGYDYVIRTVKNGKIIEEGEIDE